MDPYIGEIRAVAFPFAPRGWALCQGQTLPIAQNAALYSLLGTTYGGDGRTTFNLPDLRGRAIVNPGQGVGLSRYQIGQQAGTESVTLNLSQMPAHTHSFSGNLAVSIANGNSNAAASDFLASSSQNQYAEEAGAGTMAAGMITGTAAPVGNGQAHDNRQPYLALNYVIALQGVFPPRP